MTKIIFMGTPEFSATVLKGLLANNYEVIAAVTQPDKPVGRKKELVATPVKKVALENNIPVYQPEKLSGSEEIAKLINLSADLLITAAYGQFLPVSLLESVTSAINVHGSLLPKYRGGAPIQRAIMNGDQQTGITIMYMVKAMDAGDMIAKTSVDILPTDTGDSMFEKLAVFGRDLLLETLPSIINQTNNREAQDESQATISPNIAKEEEQLDINDSAINLVNKIRALNSNPGAWMNISGNHTKIWLAQVVEDSSNEPAGVVIERTKKKLVIKAGENAISLQQLQPAGKKTMDINSFLNGVGRDIKVGQNIVE
ncbi:methionyl-tRNA formyltransferase [Lactobacillus sp. YT155]|uniref:methionyl-tRNA formyltransferase n=1 Tax=Lactobacillus sp. YT155 TaxID=3060955 RepID=UPI00265E24C9|nr:methionyl-tRNA formyltransferase [Lactobacillus sp. YT155]MDO1605548.1 methionyl-tRNA formyltransferase [Lactobacillus sp. YT155]